MEMQTAGGCKTCTLRLVQHQAAMSRYCKIAVSYLKHSPEGTLAVIRSD
jgi:hypothetical protein